MSVPSKWSGKNETQRLNAATLNPIAQGYVWPRYTTAPTGSLSLSYFDTTKNKPGWYGAAWKYALEEDASGNVTVTGTFNVDGAATFDTTLGVTGATTLSSTLAAGNTTITGTLSTTAAASLNSLGVTNNATVGGTLDVTGSLDCGVLTSGNLNAQRIRSNGLGGMGYDTGTGGAATQTTNRTTAVTVNKPCGAITLVSAAGSTSWQSFTVNCSLLAATDVVIVNQKSGSDKYMIHVTNVAAGSFQISFATTGGTTTEQPVFNFAVIKATAS